VTTRSSAAVTNKAQKRGTTATTTIASNKKKQTVPHVLGPAAASTPSSNALNAVRAFFNSEPQTRNVRQEQEDNDFKCDQDEEDNDENALNEYGMDMRQSRDM